MIKTLQSIRHFSTRITQTQALNKMAGKNLKEIVAKLEHFAPLSLAESWDNVGLLIEPYKERPIQKIMLTNDLTEKVLDEAVSKRTDMIISYHPPIFAPMKRITQNNWKERIVSRMLGESMALYSPHTAWDAVKGGVNEWLISALPGTLMTPIKPLESSPDCGAGRLLTVNCSLREAIDSVRGHIAQPVVQVAIGKTHSMETIIKTVAVCAGSGHSVLNGVAADLYITGEMSHHELLEAQHRNVSVIVCNHSNSERGFLRQFQPILSELLQGDCDVYVAASDADPLTAVVA